MGDLSGTLRKVTIDGVTYDVFADTNVSAIPSAYENTSVPTSGRNMRKMMRRSQNRESITLVANGAEQEALRLLSERLDDYPLSYETAAGDVYRATGWVHFETHETEENRATVQLCPRGEWSAFLA